MARSMLGPALGLGLSLGIAKGAAQGGVGEGLASRRGALVLERARSEDVQMELARLTSERAAIEESLVHKGRALYRLSRGGLLPLAGGLDGLLGHASRMARLERLVQRDLEALRRTDERARDLRKEAAKRSAKVTQVERELQTQERAQAAAFDNQVRRSAGAPAQRLPAATPPERVAYGFTLSGDPAPGKHERFAGQRGSLALPVAGPLSIREATRAESAGPGLEFEARYGASVRAVAAGRVAFADSYGSYGRLVILDHGNRYYTAYGGFATIEVQVGDEVSKSARLGTADAGPVYFEVRKRTRTEDARAWLGL